MALRGLSGLPSGNIPELFLRFTQSRGPSPALVQVSIFFLQMNHRFLYFFIYLFFITIKV